MLLLDGATLVSMAEWIGALVLADQLRRVMDGKAVRELKESLRGVYPEVFGYTAYFKNLAAMKSKSAKEHDVPVSGTVVLSVGVRLLLAFFEGIDGSTAAGFPVIPGAVHRNPELLHEGIHRVHLFDHIAVHDDIDDGKHGFRIHIGDEILAAFGQKL